MSAVANANRGDFTANPRVLVVTLMAVFIGVVSAFVALALTKLIGFFTNVFYYQRFAIGEFTSPAPGAVHLGVWSVFIPILGGLIIGMMARYGSEKIRGHGIPEALEAILIGRSRMEARVAVLKPLSSALSIGTGGPFGAEGPIIMTGGAIGSLFAQLFHLSAAERRALLVAGAAAGMSAIFDAPVAAVLLAVELLLFEWRPRSFIPVSVASAVAAVLRVPLLGAGPIFPVHAHATLGAEGLIAAFVIGLFVGIGGLIDPRVLGVGYDTIHSLLRGEIIGAGLAGLLIGKSLIWSIALGSGTSGGVLAPLLMMGGALGALESRHIPIGDASLWATIGMAAMMGGTMRSPLTAMVFTLELTSDYSLLPALLVGCVASYAVTVLMLRRSILTEKVARRGYHITREYSIDPLAVLRVGDVMDRDVPTIHATMKVKELSDKIAHHDPRLTRRQGLPIVDETGKLVGII